MYIMNTKPGLFIIGLCLAASFLFGNIMGNHFGHRSGIREGKTICKNEYEKKKHSTKNIQILKEQAVFDFAY